MATTLDKIDLSDKYHDALRAIIEAKIAGKEIVTVEVEEKPVMDIMTALKKSIEQAKSQKKPMEKAKGKKKTVVSKEAKVKSEGGDLNTRSAFGVRSFGRNSFFSVRRVSSPDTGG